MEYWVKCRIRPVFKSDPHDHHYSLHAIKEEFCGSLNLIITGTRGVCNILFHIQNITGYWEKYYYVYLYLPLISDPVKIDIIRDSQYYNA